VSCEEEDVLAGKEEKTGLSPTCVLSPLAAEQPFSLLSQFNFLDI
jgi:hypothetical protein